MQRMIGLPLTKLAIEMRFGQQALARHISCIQPTFKKLGRGQPLNEKIMPNMRPLSTGMWQRPLEMGELIRNCTMHSMRSYAEVSKLMYDCWFCEQDTPKKQAVICQRCGHIQDVQSRMDYFALLGMPQTFIIDEEMLSTNLSQLKLILDPANIETRKRHEKSYAVAWGKMLDFAYETLVDPCKRAEYLLNMYGYKISGFTSDRKLILEIIEKKQEVEEVQTVEELQPLLMKVILHLVESFVELNTHFDNKQLGDACKTLDNMRYHCTLLNDIEAKQQELVQEAQSAN